VVSNQNNLVNHPIYVIDEYIYCFILTINEEYKESLTLMDPLTSTNKEVGGIWKMCFDGEYSKEGVGDALVLISPNKK